MQNPLSELDRLHVWHPFDVLDIPHPLEVVGAEGVFIHLADGRKLIDGISSWWVNLHGHTHPYIAEAISRQCSTLEHVIFAGFTHRPAVELAARLCEVLPGNLQKVFFSDNGSTAVEVAIKMAIQYWHNRQKPKSTLIALEGAYHGDTFGAMSVGARNVFTLPFQSLLFEVKHLEFPGDQHWDVVLHQMETWLQEGDIAAFIYEPLVQGAAGMRMYPAEILDKMLQLAQKYEAIGIADEVMTGFGRTGTLFASEACSHKPDIICLSKGITGGFMPLGATVCTERVHEVFRVNDSDKIFYHGHSYTANPIACAAALASLDLLLNPDTLRRIDFISQKNSEFCRRIGKYPVVKRAGSRGTILAIELVSKEGDYNDSSRDFLYRWFIERNILLRPLGNVVYFIPPYIITEDQIQTVYTAIEDLLEHLAP